MKKNGKSLILTAKIMFDFIEICIYNEI
jgi:hypothetical protein